MTTPSILNQVPKNLVELLSARARLHGDRTLYQFLGNGTDVTERMTYAQMDLRARQVGGWLQGRVEPGERVLLIFTSGLDYLSAYFGCLYAGAIAAPAYPPRKNRRADRLRSIVRDAEITLVLTSDDLISSLQETIDGDEVLGGLQWQALESIQAESADRWVLPTISQETLAFLQYTSGSTGDPKGVMVTHGNLLHNQHLIRTNFGSSGLTINEDNRDPEEKSRYPHPETLVGWLPLHHDMGLIGNALHPLYVGGQMVFMAPIDFLQKPVRWLQAISKFRGSICGAPNFAYRLCVDEVSDQECEGLDLSHWHVAFNGAEPVQAEVMRQFAKKFEPFGFKLSQFCPCYGMAETTLLITSSACRESLVIDQNHDDLVSCGKIDNPADDPSGNAMDLRIVDPVSLFEQSDGEEGEIWVSGRSVAAGYWQRPEITEEIFRARIRLPLQHGETEHRCSEALYLRTGDLGLVKEGQLYVTGRRKDLIIIRGTNHYPQDIERTVESADDSLAISGGAAFSIHLDGDERVVVVHEVRRTSMRGLDTDRVIQEVRQAIASHHDLSVAAVLLLRPGGLPKTTSGKVQRSEAKRQFLADEFRTVGEWKEQRCAEAGNATALPAAISPGAEVDRAPGSQIDVSPRSRALRQWIIARLATRLKLQAADFDVHQPLILYGIDSLAAVRLAADLSEHLGRHIPATLAYEFPTIALLADHLTESNCVSTSSATFTATNEPMAVVGIGCRLPGADSANEFWQLLVEGRDAITTPPANQIDREFFYGDRVPNRAGYLRDVDKFDASFFGISPREADSIDPQHRIMLEVTWQAFENAGIPVLSMAGHRVGMFVGASNNDYSRLAGSRFSQGRNAAQGENAGDADGYGATGNSMAMLSNRVSYSFDFRGPSLTIDTACSSSLVATHQAISSLRRGECEVAVVGGVNLILSDEPTATFARAGMLSPEGVCRAFAQGANGFVRGEGCGVVILRPLSKAIAAGNRIYAVLRGSAVNQDGRTNGLTAPSRLAQQSLIESALSDAGLEADSLDVIEAHGTGTELGDPIEMRAIQGALQLDARRTKPLVVGSVKTNIGHLEAAAGIAGLIKICLSMSNATIVPTLNFEHPSPHIQWTNVEVPTAIREWSNSLGDPEPTMPNQPRRAGVSSFGFGGANAHVVVEQAPSQPDVDVVADKHSDDAPELFVFSAKSDPSLDAITHLISNFSVGSRIQQVSFTLAAGRSHLNHRAAIICDPNSLQNAEQETPSLLARGKTHNQLSVTWMFSGQGGLYPMVGKKLYETHSLFRKHFDTASHLFQSVLGSDLRSILWGGDQHWLTTSIQPALFSLQWALAQTYWDMGVRPTSILGHSLGEYAAACMAGVFSLEDGLRMVARRAELTKQLTEPGGMLAVFAEEVTAADGITASGARCDIAALNGPRQTVVAGPTKEIEKLQQHYRDAGVTTKAMQTTHGFHSSLVDPILDTYEHSLASVTFSPPNIPFISSQSGELLAGTEAASVATSGYWRSNLRQPVRFFNALNTVAAAADGHALVLEIGAGSTLASLARSAKLGLQSLPGLSADEKERTRLLENIGRLYVAGIDFDWTVALGFQSTMMTLPSYPFERQRYWYGEHSPNQPIANRVASRQLASSVPASQHPLVGRRLDLATGDVVFETELFGDSYLADHCANGEILFPAAGFLEWAFSGGLIVSGSDCGTLSIDDLKILQPLVLSKDHPVVAQMVLSESDGIWAGRILSRSSSESLPGKWTEHARWKLGRIEQLSTFEPHEQALTDSQASTIVDQHYAACDAAGLCYGPAFRGVLTLGRTEQGAVGTVSLPSTVATEGKSDADEIQYGLHPALLDACLQVVATADGRWGRRAWLPISFEAFRLHARDKSGERLNVAVHVRRISAGTEDDAADQRTVDVRILDSAGIVVADVIGMTLKATSKVDVRGLLFRETWVPKIRDREPQIASRSTRSMSFESTRQLAASSGREVASRLVPVLDHLESIAASSVIAVLRQMGFEFTVGQRLEAKALSIQLGVMESHLRLFSRMLEILGEVGVLASDGFGWRVEVVPPLVSVESLFATAFQQLPEGRNEFELLRRCVTNLASVLRSGSDPLPLLFPRDKAISAAQVYRDSLGGRMMNSLVAKAVSEMVDQLPPGRGIRILEIGAGTGATTESILGLLPRKRTQYVFTDIASGFLATARQRFSDFDFVDFHVLDIEKTPGLSSNDGVPLADRLGSFDLIVAANVLHATTNLRSTIKNARQWLAPHGQMLIVEGTRPVRWLDLTFGLTSGWWCFQDKDIRPTYPLLSDDGWRRLLSDEGFDDVEIIQPDLTIDEPRHPENSVIVARKRIDAEEEKSTASTSTLVRRTLILSNNRIVNSQRLCTRLTTAGEMAEAVDWKSLESSSSKLENFHQSLSKLEPTDVILVVDCDGWSSSMKDLSSVPESVRRVNESLLFALQALVRWDESRANEAARSLRVWLVTEEASAAFASHEASLSSSTVMGLWRSMTLEQPTWSCTAIDFDSVLSIEQRLNFLVDELGAANQCVSEVGAASKNSESELAFHDDVRWARRLIAADDAIQIAGAQDSRGVLCQDENRVLRVQQRGSLQGLQFVSEPRKAPEPGQVEIEIHASGLNFRDVLIALDLYPTQPPLGAECAGTISRIGQGVVDWKVGDRVAAIAFDSMAKFVNVSVELITEVPFQLSCSDTASIPIAFLTSSIALERLAGIRPGDRVLVHSAAGGVGLAAVALAKHAGATVIATASKEKHATLKNLGIEHVFDSRSGDFADGVLAATSGVGVDIVLNSLDESNVAENIRALRIGGKYIDITVPSEAIRQQVSTSTRELEYHSLDLSHRIATQPESIGEHLCDIFKRVAEGTFQPLEHRNVPLEQAVNAFRELRSGKTTGKLVLEVVPEVCVDATELDRSKAGWQLITGGLGGLGMLVASDLISQGHKRVALVSRRQPDMHQQADVRAMLSLGGDDLDLRVIPAEVGDPNAVAQLIHSLTCDGNTISGVYHLAGTLNDATISRQTKESLGRVFRPKVDGAWNLHQATLGQPLKNFVLFSSASAVLGSPGQSNHSAANAFMDGLARYRRVQALPGLSIQWGPWSDVGAAAALQVDKRTDFAGIHSIDPVEGMELFRRLMNANKLALRETNRKSLSVVAALRLQPDHLPSHLSRLPLFEVLRKYAHGDQASTESSHRFLDKLRGASPSEQTSLMSDHLRRLVATTLGIRNAQSVSIDQPLFEMGVDSLTSIELTNMLQTGLQVRVSTTDLFNYPTIQQLGNRLLSLVSANELETHSAQPAQKLDSKASPQPLDSAANSPTPSIDNVSQQEMVDLLRDIGHLSEEFAQWETGR